MRFEGLSAGCEIRINYQGFHPKLDITGSPRILWPPDVGAFEPSGTALRTQRLIIIAFELNVSVKTE